MKILYVDPTPKFNDFNLLGGKDSGFNSAAVPQVT